MQGWGWGACRRHSWSWSFVTAAGGIAGVGEREAGGRHCPWLVWLGWTLLSRAVCHPPVHSGPPWMTMNTSRPKRARRERKPRSWTLPLAKARRWSPRGLGGGGTEVGMRVCWCVRVSACARVCVSAGVLPAGADVWLSVQRPPRCACQPVPGSAVSGVASWIAWIHSLGLEKSWEHAGGGSALLQGRPCCASGGQVLQETASRTSHGARSSLALSLALPEEEQR